MAQSSTSCRGSTRRVVGSSHSSSLLPKNWITIFFGEARRCSPRSAASASSTARTTKTCWSFECTPSSWTGTHEKPDDGDFEKLWKNRYEDINNFERHLHRNNTRIVKVFLHLSRDEQKKRFLKRLDDPDKRWKFSTSDLAERAHWDDYQTAYEEALSATSTPWAPWYVVPADHKYALRALVGGIIVDTIDQMDLKPPRVPKDKLAALDQAKKDLLAET